MVTYIKYFQAVIFMTCILPVAAAVKPINGFGPHVNNEPVMVNPLLDKVSEIDEDVVDLLRRRVRALDEKISSKLGEHDGRRPQRRVVEEMVELSEALSQRDQKWSEFILAIKQSKKVKQQGDILDKPDSPILGKQERLRKAMNILEAAECYRELTQRGSVNVTDLQTSATLAQSIDIDNLPVSDQARLLYLRCAIALDRSRWENPAKRGAFIKEANDAFQLLQISHPNSLLTASAGHLLEDEQKSLKSSAGGS
ncbi:MAG: hypothetical protein HRU15_16530 [Planctomycetes bacterium]|nr:hypothetical protein [Planctomycetota bacterium]